MKATLTLLAPVTLLVSCSTNQSQVGDPVAPPVSAADQYGVPQGQPPYQPIDPINPPAAPVPTGVPAPAPATTPAPAPVSPEASAQLNGNVYTIQTGDSLWAIARKFNTTVEAIQELNGLAGNTIMAGRTLIIPAR